MTLKLFKSLRHNGWTTISKKRNSLNWRGQLVEKSNLSGGSFNPIEKLLDSGEINDIATLLNSSSGFFSFIIERGNDVVLAVDVIRSIPLFYGIRGHCVYVSDSAEWVRKSLQTEKFDALAQAEFLLTGYVTGADTLYSDVKQIQAGELVHIVNSSGSISTCSYRYYQFLHREPQTYDEPGLRHELSQICHSVVQTLIRYANGRQIVLPLSGGYDSRLIATLLARLRYPNILCYTYGVASNREAEYSRRVAASLGLRWVFCEYSRPQWIADWSSSEAKVYRQFASNHSSLPHVQDWPAIKKLCGQGAIEPNAVIVPGHSADFVAGSHIPPIVFQKADHSIEDLVNAIFEQHYSNAPYNHIDANVLATIQGRPLRRINVRFDGTSECFATLYELWDWQERQAKYIVNSVRVYEQFDLDWWLPFWDTEFIKFWERVPLSLRRERIWFKTWIQDLYLESIRHTGDSVVKRNATDRGPVALFAKTVAECLPNALYKKLRMHLNKRRNANHFLAFDALVPEKARYEYENNGFSIIGMYADLYLQNKWGEIEGV